MTLPADFDLDSGLANARQSLQIMHNYVQNKQTDSDYFARTIESLSNVLEAVTVERQHSVDSARFAKLYEVSRAIGSSLDLQEVLNGVMDAIIELTGAERGFLMLLNDDGVLEVQIARNFDQETLDGSEFAVSRTITRQVFESGQPVVTTDATEDPRFAHQQSIMLHQLRSIMAAPLRSRGAITGVVYVDNRMFRALFRENDLDLLEAFAGQAAVAIENARLFAETDEKLAHRVEELKTMQWIDRQLNESLDVIKIMDVTVDWGLRMCRANSAILAMQDDDHLIVMSHAGENWESLDLSHPLIRRVMATGEADQASDDKGSLLCVAIRREGKAVGVMIVVADRENAFDSEAQALLIRLADRAAIAIENARLYQQVQQANQAKSEFVGTVAHELKVPMTSIRGYADLLEQFGTLDERGKDFVERIRSGVSRMQTLVDDLSDISRIESGNLRVEITDVNLREVIEEAKASTLAQIHEREHTLIEQIADPLPIVKADPSRTVQILVNLMSNAYKYTPNGGQITIQTQPQKDRILVSVQDTGVGLSPEELHNLGTKFWRSDNEHALKQRGTGLGFSITRQLIELMGGTLDIQSIVGQGSTFTVGLPIREG